MVKIKLSKHIYRDCYTHELGCWAHKYIKLPYAPFVGLSLHDGEGEIMYLKLIQYDVGSKITSCFVGSQIHEDYEYAKKCNLEFGWSLREVEAGSFQEDLTHFFYNDYGAMQHD